MMVTTNGTTTPQQATRGQMAQHPVETSEKQDTEQTATTKLPKGVVLGPDGKPCRTCTDVASWFAMTGNKPKKAAKPTNSPAAVAATNSVLPSDCPPDVEALGRSSWTLLHSITATYPTQPSPQLQADTTSFLSTFGKLYPCWVCAEDFQSWMSKNTPRVSSRSEFGTWMCEAHNAVNEKLGKNTFDCTRWEERWRTGWKDGRCDP